MKKAGLLVLMFCLLSACDSQENTLPDGQGAPAGKMSAPNGQETPSGAEQNHPSPVAILYPDPLTSEVKAQVRSRGCSGDVQIAWEVNGRLIPGEISTSLANTYFLRDDVVGVKVTCNGATGGAETRVANSPPKVTQISFGNPTFASGQDVEVVPEAYDHDGDPVDFNFKWFVDGTEVYGETGPVLPGEYVHVDRGIEVVVSAYDLLDEGPAYRGLAFHPVNGAPRFVSTPPSGLQALNYNYRAEAVDPEGDTVVYRLEEEPPGMSIDRASGEVLWQIEPGTTGEFKVKIVAEDADGAYAVQEYLLNLSPQE